MESFIGKFTYGSLYENWFLSLADAQDKLMAWRKDLTEPRPHSAMGNLKPNDHANRSQKPMTKGHPDFLVTIGTEKG